MNSLQLGTSITPSQLHHLLSHGAPGQLLDVRTPAEFAALHVPGASLIPSDNLDPDTLQTLRGAKTTPLYVICQSGERARKAIVKLERAEVHGCVLVEGGIENWLRAGLPVERGRSHVPSLMRQVQITVGLISSVGAALALALSPNFAVLPLVTGCGLLLAGLTGTCGLALVLAKMPWNHAPSCGACCDATRKADL